MQYEVKLPSLGDDAGDKATVSFWYFDKDDSVKEGDDLIEMVTEKATFNVPSPKNGTLVEQKVTDNDVVKIGDVLGIMEIDE